MLGAHAASVILAPYNELTAEARKAVFWMTVEDKGAPERVSIFMKVEKDAQVDSQVVRFHELHLAAIKEMDENASTTNEAPKYASPYEAYCSLVDNYGYKIAFGCLNPMRGAPTPEVHSSNGVPMILTRIVIQILLVTLAFVCKFEEQAECICIPIAPITYGGKKVNMTLLARTKSLYTIGYLF